MSPTKFLHATFLEEISRQEAILCRKKRKRGLHSEWLLFQRERYYGKYNKPALSGAILLLFHCDAPSLTNLFHPWQPGHSVFFMQTLKVIVLAQFNGDEKPIGVQTGFSASCREWICRKNDPSVLLCLHRSSNGRFSWRSSVLQAHFHSGNVASGHQMSTSYLKQALSGATLFTLRRRQPQNSPRAVF